MGLFSGRGKNTGGTNSLDALAVQRSLGSDWFGSAMEDQDHPAIEAEVARGNSSALLNLGRQLISSGQPERAVFVILAAQGALYKATTAGRTRYTCDVDITRTFFEALKQSREAHPGINNDSELAGVGQTFVTIVSTSLHGFMTDRSSNREAFAHEFLRLADLVRDLAQAPNVAALKESTLALKMTAALASQNGISVPPKYLDMI